MCILPPIRWNQKIKFDLAARIGASNLQEIFNLQEKMRQELNISILGGSFDQNTAQCKMAQQVKASSAKIVAHRGSKFEVDRCHQLSSPVISCQYFHHLLLERPENWWWCHQLLKGTGWWVKMMYKNTGCFFTVPKKTSLSTRIFPNCFPSYKWLRKNKVIVPELFSPCGRNSSNTS